MTKGKAAFTKARAAKSQLKTLRSNSMNETDSNMCERKLDRELELLKKKLDLGHELKVIWDPKAIGKLSGEVKANVIFVYERSKQKALETLRHEFLDYAISKVIEPYKDVANKIIMLINEQAYRRKEDLIDNLSRLFKSSGVEG